MPLLDVVTPAEALGEALTSAPVLAAIAALIGAGLAIAAFFVFRKKK